MLRSLADRWHFGVLPQGINAAVAHIASKLRLLEATLQRLHAAIEYPPPQVLFAASATGATTINSTTATAIAGCSASYTPDVASTAYVVANFDVECTTFGAATNSFVGELYLNGAARSRNVIYQATALNARLVATQTFTIALAAGAAFTFDLRGRTSNIANIWNVAASNTALFGLVFPNLYTGVGAA